MYLSSDTSGKTIVAHQVTNPQATHQAVLEKIKETGGGTITDSVFLHCCQMWIFTIDRRLRRPISGPDNAYGLPESDFI